MKKPTALISAAAAITAAGALAITGASLANADDSPTTTTQQGSISANQVPGQQSQGQTQQGQTQQGQAQQGQPGQMGGGQMGGGQRSDETALTGTDLEKATTAAKAAQPDATVVRAEKDADGGGVYEVHMTKSDGSQITVFLDADFKVTSTAEGMGGPGGGMGGGHGQMGGANQQGQSNVDPNTGTTQQGTSQQGTVAQPTA